MKMAEPILLDDEQVREYIANGYVKVELSVPAEIHVAIARKLDLMLERGPNLGNNLLPHAPEFRHVLNAPEVRGALTSLLGEDYIEHPHRYCHTSGPADELPEDMVAAVGKKCHQDSYTPLSQPRQHYPRYARIIYYPRDTPLAHGPTHVTPGTHFQKVVTDQDRATTVPMEGAAGSLWITHFDIIHGAGINLSDVQRHMIKFIYKQRRSPTSPSWDSRSLRWKNPKGLQVPWDLEVVWSHIWDWMCGQDNRYESFQAANRVDANGSEEDHLAGLGSDASLDDTLAAIRQLAASGRQAENAVPALIGLLNNGHQVVRTAVTYALGAIGEPAVESLVTRLKEADGAGWQEGSPASWSESAIRLMDEAHALGAIGSPAVASLVGLLESCKEWGRINAAFALGEMDARAAEAVPALVRCLDDGSHRVVRTVLDALGAIGGDGDELTSRIGRFLVESRPEWDQPLPERPNWLPRDQVRANASTALARLGGGVSVVENELIQALDDPCGYVGLLATDALQHMESSTAQQAVSDLVMAQRWDPSLGEGRRY